MSWKRFQRVIWALLAVCAGGVFLMYMVSGRGYALVFGQVDDGTIAWTLISIFLLALVIWGNGAIVAFTRGWERAAALVFVLMVEGLLLLTVLFFSVYFYTNPTYSPIYAPDGEVGPVPEVVTHRGKMGQLLAQRVPQKPPVCYICLGSAQRSPQRGIPIQMLQQYDFEQYHWVDAPPARFFAVQRLHDFVQFLEIYRCIHLPQ